MTQIKELKDYVNRLDELEELSDPGDVVNKLCNMISKLPEAGYAAAPAYDGIEFAKFLEENTRIIYEDKITLYRYEDAEGVGNYTLDDIHTVFMEKYCPVNDTKYMTKDDWIKAEDRLPDIDTPVYVITEYMSSGKPMKDYFMGYMDEYGDTLICPNDESYGWKFNDCVTHWRPVPPMPQSPKEEKE